MLWLVGQVKYECMSGVIHGAQTVSHAPRGVIGGKTGFFLREHHLDLPTRSSRPQRKGGADLATEAKPESESGMAKDFTQNALLF